ncbi:hypothetical protein VTI74DRAFT_1835 [Chaetomium olivicolor]
MFLAQRAPPEVVLHILQCSNSTRDLLALASHASASARFSLLAARMTQLVVDAERRGELPPTPISPGQLQHAEQPTLAELRAAFGLHRLSRALAGSFCQRATWFPSDRHDDTPEEPDHAAEWMARVSHALSRALIVGAALAGTYREPLLKAKEHPVPDIRAILFPGSPQTQPSLASAVVVFFGTWRAEEVTLPACITGHRDVLNARPVVDDQDKHDAVACLLSWIFDYSGRPNHYGWREVYPASYDLIAPLEPKFFEYFLERHLGLCFDPTTFSQYGPETRDRSYQDFAHDDVENRRSCDTAGPLCGGVEFLDGSEILAKYPHDVEPFYRPRE